MPDTPRHILAADGLTAGYGSKPVINGVSVAVRPGEVVVLIGHNGAGKSTLLKTLFGVLPRSGGTVRVDEVSVPVPTPRGMLAAGIAYVPQGNRVFGDLTVGENLEVGGTFLPSGANLREEMRRVLALFPALRPRLRQRAGSLSGGEKQMLALATASLRSPRLLLLDEPCLGLAPAVARDALGRIELLCRDAGTAFLIVEQHVRDGLRIAQRVFVLRNGAVSYEGPASDLHDDDKLRQVYL